MSDPKPLVEAPTGFKGVPHDPDAKKAWYWPAAFVFAVVTFFNSELYAALVRYLDAHVQAVQKLDAIDARITALEEKSNP